MTTAMTTQQLHVSTRKGLFVLEGVGADAHIVGEHFLDRKSTRLNSSHT